MIIRNSMLNGTDNTSKRGRQLKAMTPVDHYSKVDVSEAECSVRFINAGNLEILGDGILFFLKKEEVCNHIESSRRGTCCCEGTMS